VSCILKSCCYHALRVVVVGGGGGEQAGQVPNLLL
jgi:hypothetical protein